VTSSDDRQTEGVDGNGRSVAALRGSMATVAEGGREGNARYHVGGENWTLNYH
jgi:membrane protein implicated in regulation of membrane protease activity